MKRILLLLTAVSFAVACSNSNSETDKKSELESLRKQQAELKEKINQLESELSTGQDVDRSKLVSAEAIQAKPFMHLIEIQAKVEGDQDVLLSAEASGTVKAVNVVAGDRVQAGQTLAVIDDKIIRQNMAELESQLELSRQLYNRQKNLWDQKIGSEIQYLQAKTNFEAMQNRMEAVQEQLAMTRIKSPINGTVDETMIKVGQTVMPGMAAIRVVNLSELKVKGEVAESFINRVKKGDDVILNFPDMGKEIETNIDYSGSRIDPLNRTFNVEVRLNEKMGSFHPNMIVVMKIVDYKNPKAFVVPVGAVQKSADGEFVYVAQKNGNKFTATRKSVKTGMIYNGYVEVTSGLEEGDQVITVGYQNVIEGDPVSI